MVGVVLRQRYQATKKSQSPSSSSYCYKHTLEDGSKEQQRLGPLSTVSAAPPSPQDTTEVTDVLSHVSRDDESLILFSPQQPDSGFHSVSDSILEEGEGTETCKTERPTNIVTRRGEHVSLKRKERESERISNLQDEDLFEGGLIGESAFV